MRKLLDKVMHRLGYVRWDHTIQGEVEFKRDEQPFVNLAIPGGNRIYGWVDNRMPVVTYGDNPLISDLMNGATMAWAVDYDYRSDNGPDLVGPFDTREQAERWADTLAGPGWAAEFSIVPLAPPT